jgi:hypothetical protein
VDTVSKAHPELKDQAKIKDLVMRELQEEHKKAFGGPIGEMKVELEDGTHAMQDCLCNNCCWVAMGAPFAFIEQFWSKTS